tara:strand:+ start:250 stop:600 length:351 start_codon:yes stop_codon:yes gene_type:complete
MVKVFLLGVIITFCNISRAQELLDDTDNILQKPVECYDSQSVIDLAEEQGLDAFWQGKNLKDDFPDNTIVIMVDPVANGWMVFEMNMQVACMLGYGQSFWLFDQLYPYFESLQETE